MWARNRVSSCQCWIASDNTIDLAILKFLDIHQPTEFSGCLDWKFEIDQDVIVAGFPNFNPGHQGVFIRGKVVGLYMQSGIQRVQVSAPIISGNSGGPVLNGGGEVVGVAVTGSDDMSASSAATHGVIPIGALQLLTTSFD